MTSKIPTTDQVKPDEAIPDEALQGDLQPASRHIWHKEYRLKNSHDECIDETVTDTWKRVARALDEVESKRQAHWEKEFLWALENGAIPAGRVISNAGALAWKPATSTINCTVSGTIEDSMLDILQKNLEAGLTLKAGCGIGYEFSTLRPKGAYVAGRSEERRVGKESPYAAAREELR